MMDWIGIVSACGLAAVVGLGFVMWERFDSRRLTRERQRRRLPGRSHPLPIRPGRRAA
jgi:hypothetical protein